MNADVVGAFLDASAAALGLRIAPAHRPGVLRYLELATSQARLVMAVPLTPADEAATVFQPVPPAARDRGADPTNATGAAA
jgi:Protein of unknown function (DUF4089)